MITETEKSAIREAIALLAREGVVCVDGGYAIAAVHPIIDGRLMHPPDTPEQHAVIKALWADEDAAGKTRSHVAFVRIADAE